MKAYSKYKESGNNWIKNIPEHWSILNLKRFSSLVNGSTPKSATNEYWDGDIVWITPTDLGGLNGNKTISDSTRKITEAGLNSCGTSLTPKGSIILSTRAPIGHLALTDIQSCTNQGCKTIVPDLSRINNVYLYYYLFVFKEILQSLGQGSTFVELSSQSLKDFASVFPPFLEQQAIADFLDRKTAQIDKLIEKKQRQIDLLQEQRTALINHAVTKGLNPDVRMKDSGVEWLGEIPSHWIVSKLKYVCYVSDGNHGEEYPEETDFTDEANGVPFIRVTEFEGFNITRNGILYITKEKNESMRKGGLQENDILFVNRGSIGKMALVSKEFEGANLNSQIAYFRVTSPKMNYKYLLYFLYSGTFQKMISSLIHGGALQQLPLKRIIGLEVLCPPLEDQIEIVNYLEKITTKADLSIKSISKEIELVQEYRTALISEAVTGKIDVR